MNYVDFAIVVLVNIGFIGAVLVVLGVFNKEDSTQDAVWDAYVAEHFRLKNQIKMLEDKINTFEKWAQEVNNNQSDNSANTMLSLVTFYKKKTGKILFPKKEMKQMFGDNEK